MRNWSLDTKKILLVSALLFSHSSYSQTPPTLSPAEQAAVREAFPSSAEPSRIGQQLPPTNAPKELPRMTLPAAKPQAPTPAAQLIKFKLNQLIVTGSTLYTVEELEPLYKNYLGKMISLADLQQITDSITKKYREDGYIISKAIIPAQHIKNGIVTLRIIEGYVSNVTINGDPKGARSLLQAYGKRITADRPLNIDTLERYVLLANDIPGASVKVVLSPAQTATTSASGEAITPGAAEATLIAEQHTANGYVSYDNRGTVFLGPQQYSAGANLNSIFLSGDQTSFQTLFTPDFPELQFYRLSYQTPLNSDGLQLILAGSDGISRPQFNLAPFNVVGTTNSAFIGISYPLIRSRSDTLTLTADFDTLNSETTVSSTMLYDDHIRSIRVGANFSNSDTWQGVNQVSFQMSQGLRILGANPADDVFISRVDGDNSYNKININLSRTQWISESISVNVAGQTQYAFDPLLAAEQFSYGGAQFGLAYDPSQITGDRGATGKVELRYDTAPNFRFLQQVQYYVYYDVGKVWNVINGTLIGPVSGASAGIGFRSNFNKYVAGSLLWSKPLTSPASSGVDASKNPRIFFSITLLGDTPGGGVETTTTPVPTTLLQPVSGQSVAAVMAR